MTSELRDTPLFRITVEPSETNGLRKTSQIMVDKIQTVARTKVGKTMGHLEQETMLTVNRALTVFLGVA